MRSSTLGRLVPEKGVATLVRAAAKARVRLRIIGTGPEEAALRRLAQDTRRRGGIHRLS